MANEEKKVTKATKIARAILSPENIHIAEEIANVHFTDAMKAGNKPRVRELAEVLSLIEEVRAKGEAED